MHDAEKMTEREPLFDRFIILQAILFSWSIDIFINFAHPGGEFRLDRHITILWITLKSLLKSTMKSAA